MEQTKAHLPKKNLMPPQSPLVGESYRIAVNLPPNHISRGETADNDDSGAIHGAVPEIVFGQCIRFDRTDTTIAFGPSKAMIIELDNGMVVFGDELYDKIYESEAVNKRVLVWCDDEFAGFLSDIEGTLIREDPEDPSRTVIRLDDNQVVLGSEFVFADISNRHMLD